MNTLAARVPVVLRRTDGTEGMLLTDVNPLTADLLAESECNSGPGYIYRTERYAIGAPKKPAESPAEVVARAMLGLVLGIGAMALAAWLGNTVSWRALVGL